MNIDKRVRASEGLLNSHTEHKQRHALLSKSNELCNLIRGCTALG